MMRASLPWVALATLACPSAAQANFWEIYGFGPRALGMANCQVAVADDFTAVFYNPAALTAGGRTGFGVGFTTSQPSLSLDFDQLPALEPLRPDGASALSFGTLFSLGSTRGVRKRLAMALAFSLPTRSLLSGQAIDPAVPQWYLYQSLPQRIVFALGLSARPFDWLAIGAGVQVLAGLSGVLDYELDIVAGRFSKKTVIFDIEPVAAPLLGLELVPIEHLRLGVAYRADIATGVDLPISLEITGVADLDVGTQFTVQYMPHHLVAGASYSWPDLELLLTAELGAMFWSGAPDPSVDSRIDAAGDLLVGTGLAGALDVPAPGQERSVDLAFRDVLVPRIGIEKTFDILTVRAGYALKPSPAPVQTSGSNYIDGTAHQLGLGASVRFHAPWDLFANPLILDVGGSLSVLPGRRHQKIDSSDPVGSYVAGGHVIAVGVALRYFFTEDSIDRPPVLTPAAPEARPADAPEPRVPARREPTP